MAGSVRCNAPCVNERMAQKSNWSDLLVNVVGHEPPVDSLELRNSFIENCLADQDGKKVTQAQIHLTMQQGIYDWEQEALSKNARLNGLIRAPYNTGKSQQVPIGLSAYMTTRKHELETLIVSADGGISAKRILSLRALFMSDMYRYWCKEHNFSPVEFDRTDTGSTQRIIVKSRNRTGNPTYEAYAVLTQTTGQRAGVLILDDVCNDTLFMSDMYRYWCKEHNFSPVEFDRTDTGSTQRIIVKSRNRTGNPTYEAYAVLTQTTGQRAGVLILDDVCNDEDRISTARRETVWNKVSNTWIKRVHDKGIVLSVCTPYHPNDANSRLMKSGIFNVLQISVKEDKTGYKVEEWNNLK